MNKYVRLNALTVLFVFAGFVSLAVAAVAQSAPSPQQSSSTPPTAEHTFKNIKVLNEIPSNQLIPAMQFINASLGVECGFCHVENHFDQDDKKPKVIARKMMQMTAAINQSNFDGHREVTCNSCHRGARVPAGIPAISQAPPAPRAEGEEKEPSLAGLPSAADLINKYVAAVGGEKALQGISSRAVKGTTSFAGRELAVDIYSKAPDKQASLTHLPNGDAMTILNGQQAWSAFPGRPPRDLPPAEVEGARIDADLQFPLHIQQMFPDLRPAPPETIAGHDTFQLVSGHEGEPKIQLYFDKQRGFLVRMVRYGNSPLGLNPVRVDFSDYRPVDGVQVPYHSTVARPGGQSTVQVLQVKQNVEIDDAKFAKPAAPQQAAARP